MIFFVINLAMAVVVWLFFPETSGRTLEEIDYMYFGDCDRLVVVGKNGRTLPGFRSMMKRPENLETGTGHGTAKQFVQESKVSSSQHLETLKQG